MGENDGMEGLTDEDPRWIGDYRLLGRLGSGGMGRVYLARSGGGRTVAVKLIKAERAADAEFRRRFRREVEAARRVNDAWTAPVLDADTEADVPWVATGYVAGPTLQETVDLPAEAGGHGPLPERTIASLAFGLAQALRDIHAAGLIHRDLKPSNVLITIDGPRVIDFGIARVLGPHGEGGTHSGLVVGSPSFMSPEQVRGERVTPASDVFCLGSVLAYAATGRAPFGSIASGIHAVMFRIVEEAPDLDGAADGALGELIAACLAKEPAMRPAPEEIVARTRPAETGPTAPPWLPAALIAQLGRHAVRLLDTDTPPPPGAGSTEVETLRLPGRRQEPYARYAAPGGASPPEPRPRRRKRWPVLLAAAVAVAAIGAGTALTVLRGEQTEHDPTPPSDVPSAYTGVWSGTAERDGQATATLRRFVISRGDVGEVVATSISAGRTYQCKSEGRLVSADDQMLLDTTVVKSRPEGRCSALGEHALKLSSDGTLKWSAAGRTARLRKIDPDSERIPDRFLGVWEQRLSAGTRRMTVKQVPVGSRVLSVVSDLGGKHCEASAELISVGKKLRLGPASITKSIPEGGCQPGDSSTLVFRDDNGRPELYREFHGGHRQPRAFTQAE